MNIYFSITDFDKLEDLLDEFDWGTNSDTEIVIRKERNEWIVLLKEIEK